MQNVQRTETREERRVTREYFTDSNQDSIPTIQSNNVHNFSSNKTTNSLDNNFSNQNLGQGSGWPSLPSVEPFSSSPVQSSILNQNKNQQQQQQNWTTTNRTSSNTSTSTNKVFSSDMFDDANNDINNFFTPTPSPSINTNTNTNINTNNTSSRLQDLQNNTSTNRKTVNTSNTTKTNKTFVSDSVDDERNRTTTNNNFSSPYSTRPGSAADSYPGNNPNPNNSNNITNGRQTNTDTSKLTLEERLNSKQMKTCKVEDIWKVEDTRYTMLIPVGGQYGPEDVNITMKDRVMQVVVKKEKISQYDGKSLGFEGFGKSFSVPRDANFQGIRSTFTTDGQLKIEVPRNK